MTTKIKGPHCQECGSTRPEDLDGPDGYTTCCNERTVWTCDPYDCYHDENDHHSDEENTP